MGEPRKKGRGGKGQDEKRAAGVADATRADERRDGFYGGLVTEFAQRTGDSGVIVNVPIWGYPGHGKTCSILTAIHFCRAHIHSASFALINDTSELGTVAAQYPQFDEGELALAANRTREFLGELMARFFGDNEWPDATEQPAQYLLEVQALGGTLGYVLLPDIQGGSYETSDEISRLATKNAHAMLVLVDPADYVNEDDPRTADYRKEVLRRLQHCARDGVATCVMITMADEYGKVGDAADRTEKELTRVLAGQGNQFKDNSRLMRVSVLGDGAVKADGKPPPAKDRRPEALIEGWIWAVSRALLASRETTREQPPHIGLSGTATAGQVAAPAVPTLRRTATIDEVRGAVVCALSSDARADAFLFRDGASFLEVEMDADSKTVRVLREWPGPEPSEDDEIQLAGTTVVVGAWADTSKLYWGGRGEPFVTTSLPVEVQSWRLIEPRRLIGISANGTIHSFYLRGETWEDIHHVPGVFPVSENARCGFISKSRIALIMTGADVYGVDISVRGRFGEFRKPDIAARFDDAAWSNAEGYFLARMKDTNLVAGREKQLVLGLTHPSWFPDCALHDAQPYVAWITPTAAVRAAALGKKPAVTTEEHADTLDAEVTGLCWNYRGDGVLASLANGSLHVYRRIGF